MLDEAVDAVRVERRLADVELVEDDPERPKVNRMIVWLLLHQLGSLMVSIPRFKSFIKK